jgi:hypothetical protein
VARQIDNAIAAGPPAAKANTNYPQFTPDQWAAAQEKARPNSPMINNDNLDRGMDPNAKNSAL